MDDALRLRYTALYPSIATESPVGKPIASPLNNVGEQGRSRTADLQNTGDPTLVHSVSQAARIESWSPLSRVFPPVITLAMPIPVRLLDWGQLLDPKPMFHSSDDTGAGNAQVSEFYRDLDQTGRPSAALVSEFTALHQDGSCLLAQSNTLLGFPPMEGVDALLVSGIGPLTVSPVPHSDTHHSTSLIQNTLSTDPRTSNGNTLSTSSSLPRSIMRSKYITRRSIRHSILHSKLGFAPSDCDTIPPHGRKRYFCEALERYVEHIEGLATSHKLDLQSMKMEDDYDPTDGRATKSVLVYTINTLRLTQRNVVEEEELYLQLRDELFALSQISRMASVVSES